MTELVLPSAHPSPQPKSQIDQFSCFCTGDRRVHYLCHCELWLCSVVDDISISIKVELLLHDLVFFMITDLGINPKDHWSCICCPRAHPANSHHVTECMLQYQSHWLAGFDLFVYDLTLVLQYFKIVLKEQFYVQCMSIINRIQLDSGHHRTALDFDDQTTVFFCDQNSRVSTVTF